MGLLLRRFSMPTVLVVLAAVMAMPAAAQAGRIVNVSTSTELQNAVRNALAGDEIVVAPGTYYPTLYLSISANNVTVRGATGNRDDVIIRGAGMNVDASNREGFAIYGDDVELLVADRRYGFVHGLAHQVVKRSRGQEHSVTDRIDDVVASRVLGLPIFLLLMALVFTLTSRALRTS